MHALLQLDYDVFKFINHDMGNAFFDFVFPLLTELHRKPIFWIFVAGLLFFWIKKEKKRALVALAGLVLSIGVSETISYRVIKNYVARPRPQFTRAVEATVRTPSYSGESFPSIHASNNFAAAVFLSAMYPPLAPAFFLIASLVAFSRVYVGVHFPSDVLAGVIIGILCGLLVREIFRRLKVTKIHFARKAQVGRRHAKPSA